MLVNLKCKRTGHFGLFPLDLLLRSAEAGLMIRAGLEDWSDWCRCLPPFTFYSRWKGWAIRLSFARLRNQSSIDVTLAELQAGGKGGWPE